MDNKWEGKGTGSSGTLLMAWGATALLGSCSGVEPFPEQGLMAPNSPKPPTPGALEIAGALPLLEATLPSRTAPQGGGTTSSPPGTPLPRAEPAAQR